MDQRAKETLKELQKSQTQNKYLKDENEVLAQEKQLLEQSV